MAPLDGCRPLILLSFLLLPQIVAPLNGDRGGFSGYEVRGLAGWEGLPQRQGGLATNRGHTGQSGVASRVGVVSREGQFEPARAVCL